ncbi:MAG: sensor histidine kinase [Nanoarchaeota archaeon]|nr:sensor histidine kinase [Nanoarchaeota archaeon]
MRLKYKLTMFFALFSLAIIIVSGFTYLYYSTANLKQLTQDRLESLSKVEADRLDFLVQRAIKDAHEISGEQELAEYIHEFHFEHNLPGTPPLTEDESDEEEMLEESLSELLNDKLVHTEFQEIFVLDLNGVVEFSTDMNNKGVIKAEQPYFINGRENIFVQNFFFSEDLQRYTSIVSAPILLNGTLVGVAAGRLDLDLVENIFAEYAGLGQTGEIYIVASDGILASKSRFIPEAEFKKKIETYATRECLAGNSGAGVYEGYLGKMRVGVYTWLPQREACIIAEMHESEALAPINRLRYFLLNMGIVLLLISVMLGFFLAERIASPINKIRNAAIKVGKGEFEARARVKTHDEVEELADDFNNMITELNKYHQKNTKRTKWLESEVSEKTKKMDVQIEDMKSARLATLNMMEDLDVAYKTLQEESILKDELFNITSHELKSPLVPILGYLDLLMHGKVPGHLTAEQKEAMEVISRNASRLSDLIEDVLDIARLQSKRMKFNFTQESLSAILKEVEQRFRKTAEDRKIHFLVDVSPKLPKMNIDKSRMVQVFSNILSNAVKFTERGAISVHAKVEGNHVIVDIADTGIGVSKKDIPHIFDKFYQAESSLTRKHGGSGLGLAIVRGILEEHGGTVSAMSEQGKGSVFTVKLPIKREKEKEKRKINIAEKIKKFRHMKKKERHELKKMHVPEEEIASFFK